jgi:trimethylamine--corrinoid protein Co-methyltransferase
MDADFCAAMHTYLRGLPVDDNALALDAFREVGPGKHFFGCAHTLKNYETAFWDSAIADNNSFEQWRDAGEKTATQRASEKCRAMLRAYEMPPIDPAIDEALHDFIARKKQAVGDMWH